MELNFDFLFLPSPPFLSVIPSQAQFKLEAYEKELEGKHADFHKLSFWSYFCKAGDGTTRKLGAKAALVALEEAEAQLDSEKRILDENVQLCSIFELDIIEASRKHVNDMKLDLKAMGDLWVVSSKLETFMEAAAGLDWAGIDLEAIEEGAKAHLKQIKSLAKYIRWSSSYQSLDKTCKDFLSTIPLISLLGSKSMRRKCPRLCVPLSHTALNSSSSLTRYAQLKLFSTALVRPHEGIERKSRLRPALR